MFSHLRFSFSTFALLLSVSFVLFSSCSKSPSGPDNQPPVVIGDVVKDTTIDASAGPVTVILPREITIVVPQGAAPAGSHLKIIKVYTQFIAPDSAMKLGAAYDVTLGTATQFSPALRITMYYDSTYHPRAGMPHTIGAAWYNESGARWSPYAGVVIDTVAHTVAFSTSHLTKLSSWTLRGYTDWTSTLHFNVYWNASGVDAPPSNTAYNHKPAWHTGPDPDFIQDLGSALEDAYKAYPTAGLQVHTGMVDVYVKHMSDPGLTSYFGNIFVSNDVSGTNQKPPMWQALQSVAAHEYLHYCQNYYYVWIGAGNITKWWLEATAVQADRIVWPTSAYFEAIDFADNQLDMFINRSWDDCAEDPNWYVAGGFLTYLANYRTGTHADIVQLLKNGGSNTSVSYFRTMIDDYLKNTLSATGIGSEYGKYIQWAYEGLGVIRIAKPSTATMACDIDCSVSNSGPTAKIGVTLPHLSARIAKIYMRETTIYAHTLVIKGRSIPTGMRALVYSQSSSTSGMSFVKELKSGDSATCWLHRGAGMGNVRVDVLVINETKDNDLKPDIDVSIDAQETVPFSISQKIDGYALGVHGNQVIVNVSGTITGPKGVAVIKAENFAYDGMFEYPQRSLKITVSPQAFMGIIQNFSISFTKPPETEVDSMLESDWKWTWKKFVDGTVAIHSPDDDSWSHPATTGGNFSTDKKGYVWGFDTQCGATTEYETSQGKATRTYNYSVTFDYK